MFCFCLECELDGHIYQNGEKVLTTDRPCHVCYCRGGHIVCAPLECYRRSDCTPRLEPGSCCPKYDHCPPLGKFCLETNYPQ